MSLSNLHTKSLLPISLTIAALVSGPVIAEGEPAAEAEAPVSCAEAAKSLNTAFDSLSTQFTGDTTLITTELFQGYTAWSDGSSDAWYKGYPRALGIRATASAATDTATESDFGNTSLLLRDGAMFGLTFSLMGSPTWGHWKQTKGESCTDKDNKSTGVGQNPTKWVRNFRTDKYYLAQHPVTTEKARAYVLHGLTLKAIRQSLVDDNENTEQNDDGNNLASAATFYIGLGFDGKIGRFGEDTEEKTTAGTIDFHFGWEKTFLRSKTLQNIYGDPAIDDDSFEAHFATLRLHVTDAFFVDIEHVAPKNSRPYMEEVTAFRLGYNI